MTAVDDERLRGRHPEFARMSRKPGIGHGAMAEVASVLLEHGVCDAVDVPCSLRHGNRLYPLGRYLRSALRDQVGIDKEDVDSGEVAEVPELARKSQEMQLVRADAFARSVSFASALLEKSAGGRASVEARYRIFKQGKKL